MTALPGGTHRYVWEPLDGILSEQFSVSFISSVGNTLGQYMPEII